MFIVLVDYLKPLDAIDALLPAHRAFLDRHYAAGHFVVSGAQNPRTGGLIIAQTMERTQLDTILAEDPFCAEKAARYRIIEFTPSKFALGIASLLSTAEPPSKGQ